jgi:hypothetical protein
MRIVSMVLAAVLAAAVAACSSDCCTDCCAPVGEWRPLFDGKSIEGWKVAGGTARYKVEEGAILGMTTEGSPNSFLVPPGFYDDFELTFEVKVDDALNSGVQIRSHILEQDKEMGGEAKKKRVRPKGTVFGYQVEIAGNGNGGRVWDEARHTRWHDPEPTDVQKAAFKKGEWNKYRVVAQGDRIRVWVNGTATSDFRDKEDASGILGFQVHGIKAGTGPYQVRWRNIMIRNLDDTIQVD